MAVIELSTVAAETVIDIAGDKFPFIDISETPDGTNTVIPKVFRDAIFPGVLWANDSATLQLAFDALEASATAKKLILSGTYTLTATTTLDALVGKIVEGNGATIAMTGASTIYGIRMTGVWSNSTIRNINFTSDAGGTHIGILWDSTANNSTVERCIFGAMWQGIVYDGTFRNRIINCTVTGASNAGIVLNGEYCVVSGCTVHTNTAIGVQLGGGNNALVGNTIQYNATGVHVHSGANSDHGIITGNTVNHNTKCGIYLEQLTYGMVITGNVIAATDGANFGAAPKDSSFGIYIYQGTGVQITGNEFLRNKFNLAIEGINKSLITSNTFIPDNTLTTRHVYEVGGTNASFLVDGNMFTDDLLTNSVVLATDVPGATLGTNLVV